MTAAVREKISTGLDSGTSLTVKFDETTPLDDTHTLVAVVQYTGIMSDYVSNSWGVGFANGSANNGSLLLLGMMRKQGDGTTNDFTINFGRSISSIAVALYAFKGYFPTSTTYFKAANFSASTSVQLEPISETSPGQAQIQIAAVGLTNGGGGTWNAFTAPFEDKPAQSKLKTGVVALNADAANPSTSVSWTSSRAGRAIIWTIPGVKSPVIAPEDDKTNPTVQITNPTAGSTISGSVVATAKASDNVKVDRMEFYYNTTLIGKGTLSNDVWSSLPIATTQVPNGQAFVKAKAYDAAGNSSESIVTVNVDNRVVIRDTPPISIGGVEIDSVRKGNATLERIYLGTTLFYGTKPVVTTPTNPTTPTDPTTPTTPTTPSDPSMDPMAPITPIAGIFGPKGKYWAPGTPLRSDTFDQTEVIAPTWGNIAAAIAKINSNSTQNKARILLTPGILGAGGGAGSGSSGVLQNLGSKIRKYQILIAPRDGLGTVTVSGTGGGFAFVNAHGFSIMGVDFGFNSIMLRNTWFTSIGYTTMNALSMTSNGDSGMKRSFFIEPAAYVTRHAFAGDRGAARVVDPYTMTDCGIIGGYLAPAFRPIGSSSHNDTFQLSASGRPLNSGFMFIDVVVFNSSNQGIIFTETPHVQGVIMKKVLFVSGLARLSLRHAPDDATDQPVQGTNALWGGGQTMTIEDSVVIGSNNASNEYDRVSNTTILNATSSPVKSGSFTQSNQYANLTKAQLDALTELPDAAWQDKNWGPVFA
jgi:hypothetical protein